MFLKKKEIKALNDSIAQLYGWSDFFHPKKDRVELRDNIYHKNTKPCFFLYEERIVPLLHLLQEDNPLPKITVDQPAVPFMVKGADLMRPGIVALDSFDENAIVSIIDEKNKKTIALGKALFSSEEIENMDSGKVVQIIHYVGDDLWKASG